jgi:hypothetical protein
MMKPGSGKTKGGAYERKICSLLSDWVTGEKGKAIFVRSPGSGSSATLTPEELKTWGGDMIAIDPRGYPLCEAFTFEFKCYKSLETHRWLTPGLDKSAVFTFWEQTVRQTVSGRKPILICKQNIAPDQVVIGLPGISSLRSVCEVFRTLIVLIHDDIMLVIIPLKSVLNLTLARLLELGTVMA